MDNIGNLFELAETQLQNEVKAGQRRKYTLENCVDYAIKIRKWLDKRGGNLDGIYNQSVHTKKESRHLKYVKTGK